MKKFLKLVAESQPGAQGEYTVTLTDPSGRVENQFTITGGDFAFDNFQAFKEEMTGESEDNEMDIEKTARTTSAILSIPDQGIKSLVPGSPASKVQKTKKMLAGKLVAAAQKIKI